MFDLEKFNNSLSAIQQESSLIFDGKKEFDELVKAGLRISASASAYDKNQNNAGLKSDFIRDYTDYVDKYNKFFGKINAIAKADEADGVTFEVNENSLTNVNGHNQRHDKIEKIADKLMVMNNCISDAFSNSVDLNNIRSNARSSKQYSDEFLPQVFSERNSSSYFSKMAKEFGKHSLPQYKGEYDYDHIVRNMSELAKLEQDLEKNKGNNREEVSKRKYMLLLETSLKDEMTYLIDKTEAVRSRGYDKTGELVDREHVNEYNDMLYLCKNMEIAIDRKIATDKKKLDSLRPSWAVRKKKAANKNNNIKNDLILNDEDDILDISGDIDNSIIDSADDAFIFNNIENNIKNDNEKNNPDNSFLSDIDEIKPEDFKPEEFKSEEFINDIEDDGIFNRDDLLIDKKGEKKSFDDILTNVYVNDINEDMLRELNTTMKPEEAAVSSKKFKDANGSGILKQENKKKYVLDDVDTELKIGYDIKINSIDKDMVDILKLGNKGVYFGTKEYDNIIKSAEKAAKAEQAFKSEYPEYSKNAFSNYLKAVSVLEKQMERYVNRKDSEIRDDVKRGYSPNFNSERRRNIVFGFKNKIEEIRINLIKQDPEAALDMELESEEKVKNSENLTYERCRRSVLKTVLLADIKAEYAEKTKNPSMSKAEKAEAKKWLSDCLINSVKNVLPTLEDAIEGTEFDDALKKQFKKTGKMAFLARKNENVSPKLLTGLKNTIDASAKSLFDFTSGKVVMVTNPEYPNGVKERATSYDLLTYASKKLGFTSKLKQQNYKPEKSENIIKNAKETYNKRQEEKIKNQKRLRQIMNSGGFG